MIHPDRRIKDALLERYLAEAVDPDLRAELDKILAESPGDRARLEALRADSAAFLFQHPPGPLLARLDAERKPASKWAWAFRLGPALALAATLAVFVVVRTEPERSVKGSIALAVYRQVPGGSQRVSAGDRLAAGTVVRFEVRSTQSGYVCVLGKDSSGQVTVFHPYGAEEAGAYDPQAPLLSTAITLDSTPGRERLFAIVAATSFRLEPVVAAVRSGKSLSGVLPDGAAVDEMEFAR